MQESPCVHLYFSNSVEELSFALASNLNDGFSDDPFEFQSVYIPNAPLQKWLQLRLVDTLGCVMNIDYSFLERGLWNALESLLPDTGIQRLDQEQMQWLIVQYLKENDLDHIPKIKVYVSETNKQKLTYKIWQLAAELSRLFLEYERNRPEMIAAWRQNINWLSEEKQTPLEDEQRILYTELFCDSDKPLNYMTLVNFSEYVLKSLKKTPTVKPLHIFGPSQLSVFHKKLLCQLGRYFRIQIYSLNVCSEYWEDMTTHSEDKWRNKKLLPSDIFVDIDGEEIFSQEDNQLLKSWGKPGRETLKVFSDLEEMCIGYGVDFQTFSQAVYNNSESLLAQLQNDILTRSSEQRQIAQSDKSLQVTAAPSRLREVEGVFNSIVTNLSKDKDLKLTDIAVLVFDIDKYKVEINRVFEGTVADNQKVVPYSLIDSKASNESHFSQAIGLILKILSGEFNRRNVLTLFKNPCFQAKTEMNSSDVTQCLDWMIELMMLREGEGDDFSFHQGLLNLRAGKVFGNLKEYEGLNSYETSQNELLSLFSHIIDSLLSLSEKLIPLQASSELWQQHLVSLFDRFLAVPEAFPAELSIRTKLFDGLQSLIDFNKRNTELKLNFEDICQFIYSTIDGIPVSRGMYLGSGITIASLQPMRPVPFKHIYILGLGENEFPGSVDKTSFDLRNIHRKIGDISLPEKNLYLFLETIICAREKLFLSYVSEDIKEDKVFNPARVIDEISHYCRSNFNFMLKSQELALKNYAPNSFRNGFTNDGFRSVKAEDALLAKTLQENQTQVRKARSNTLPIQNRKELSVNQLVTFVRNPADSFFKENCQLPSLWTNDEALRIDEPFESENLVKRRFIETVFHDFIKTAFTESSDLDFFVSLEAHYLRLQQLNRLPKGVFGELDFQSISDSLENLIGRQDFEQIVNELRKEHEFGRVIIGEKSWSKEGNYLYCDAVPLQDFKLVGTLENCFWNTSNKLEKIFLIKDTMSKKDILKPFFMWTLGYLNDLCDDIELTIFAYKRTKPTTYIFSLDKTGFDSKEALRDWLQALVENIHLGQAVLLPLEQASKAFESQAYHLESIINENQSLASILLPKPIDLLEQNPDLETIQSLLQPVLNMLGGSK
ncbi:MAG: exodeoxyribonuclease V subunit gamma [Lentisphaeraceae bacterium]|nr:exodeoxyribonuclease V subunit gamma [Lentisphaeraceae bacterium]